MEAEGRGGEATKRNQTSSFYEFRSDDSRKRERKKEKKKKKKQASLVGGMRLIFRSSPGIV